MYDMPPNFPGKPVELLKQIYSVDQYFDLLKQYDYEIPDDFAMQRFYEHMTKDERALIENLLEQPDVLLSMDTMKQFKNLILTPYMLPVKKDYFLVDPAFLNLYNIYILNEKYEPKPNISLREYVQLEPIFNATYHQIKAFDYDLASGFDDIFSVESLKDFCRDYKIKGFSKGNKKDIFNLILTTFQNDTDTMIGAVLDRNSIAMDTYATFILEGKNALTIERVLYLDDFFIQTILDEPVMFIPNDIYPLFQQYFKDHQISALKTLAPEGKKEYAYIINNKNQFQLPTNSQDALLIHKTLQKDQGSIDAYLDFLNHQPKTDAYQAFLKVALSESLTGEEHLQSLIKEMQVADFKNRS